MRTAVRPIWVDRICCLVLFLIFLAYAGLIGLGQWQGDEFDNFLHMQRGFTFLVDRLRWSPRPFSESFFFLYGACVNYSHQSLIAPFLAFLWALFAVAGLAVFIWRRRSAKSGFYLLLPLALLAIFTAGANRWELFYWPAGAAAYLPTVAATLFLLMLTVSGELNETKGRILACAALIFAAGCSEAGAVLALIFSLLLLARSRMVRVSPPRRAPLWVWLAPAIFSLFTLLFVRTHRYYTDELPSASNPLLRGHPFASAATGLLQIVMEAAGLDFWNHPGATHSATDWTLFVLHWCRLPMLALLIAGVRFSKSLWQLNSAGSGELKLLGLAMILASWATASAALLHFGVNCCPRHQALRDCWLVMAAVSLTLAQSAPDPAESRESFAIRWRLGPPCLCLAALSLVGWHQLWVSYRTYPEIRRVLARNFAAGFDDQNREMVFYALPAVGISPLDHPLSKTFSIAANTPVSASDDQYWITICRFFGKDRLTVRPATIAGIAADSYTQPRPCSDAPCSESTH